ncbi:hypothetical protein ACHAWU_005010 [Discostella pseudostelligera]|uniref:Uncharacterized protein n=1 Tax=Discostella pseudostelligera TaxID=259834 RepID=A0ABD3MCT2_9STRA
MRKINTSSTQPIMMNTSPILASLPFKKVLQKIVYTTNTKQNSCPCLKYLLYFLANAFAGCIKDCRGLVSTHQLCQYDAHIHADRKCGGDCHAIGQALRQCFHVKHEPGEAINNARHNHEVEDLHEGIEIDSFQRLGQFFCSYPHPGQYEDENDCNPCGCDMRRDVTWPKLTSAFRPRYMRINAGLRNTPKKLPKAASKIAAASSPPTNFVNTMPIFTLTESVEVIVIPSAKLSGNALTCSMNRVKP